MHVQVMSDNEVVNRIRSGETGLYEVLVERYNNRLRRTTSKFLQNDAEVDDIVQEAHLRAFLHLNQFNGFSSFPTWLTRIAINQALTYLRSRSKVEAMTATTETPESEAKFFRSSLRDPEQHTHNQELRAALTAALSNLPAPYRTVFELREIQQLSTTEVVRRLGISETCAKSRLHRARKQLRRSLGAWAGRPSRSPINGHLSRAARS